MSGKTKIDWCTHSANPVKGLCPVKCSFCYAARIYQRFGLDPTIRFEPSALKVPRKPGARIFVGSTIELFGPWVAPEWMDAILATVRDHPEHTFIFLSNRPWRMQTWNPWPDNAWLGATIAHAGMVDNAAKLGFTLGGHRFLSMEPLLEAVPIDPYMLRAVNVRWVIIGAETGPGAVKPKISWVTDIIAAADEAGCKVFLKRNLLSLYPDIPLRQELPS